MRTNNSARKGSPFQEKIKRDDRWKGGASVSTFRVLPFGLLHDENGSVFMEE